ncbi:hypothetical protein Tco_0641316 [Tanacetum coccineum]
MAQPQRQADVHQDELCLPNKHYALMDANKKRDLDNPFTMDLLGLFWPILLYKKMVSLSIGLKFVLDKEITMTLNDFRRIFHLPQATDNNHERFLAALNYLFEHLKTRFMPRKKFNVLAQHLQEIMEESLPTMVDDRVKEHTKTQVPVYVAQGLIMERKQSQADVTKMIADAIQQER